MTDSTHHRTHHVTPSRGSYGALLRCGGGERETTKIFVTREAKKGSRQHGKREEFLSCMASRSFIKSQREEERERERQARKVARTTSLLPVAASFVRWATSAAASPQRHKLQGEAKDAGCDDGDG